MQQQLEEVNKRVRAAGPDIPLHRAGFRRGYTFSTLPFSAQLAVWDYIWKHADNMRVRLQATFFLERYMKQPELQKELWHTTAAWQDQVDGWGLCDALAKIYTRALEAHPGMVYQQLMKWNKDPDLWKRRQSLVSLLYYSRTKTIYLPFNKITAIIIPLLADKEYYVQKGVGWTMRELHNVYPEACTAFLERHIRSVSSIAFTAAIEKMEKEEKERFKGMRRKQVGSKIS